MGISSLDLQKRGWGGGQQCFCKGTHGGGAVSFRRQIFTRLRAGDEYGKRNKPRILAAKLRSLMGLLRIAGAGQKRRLCSRNDALATSR